MIDFLFELFKLRYFSLVIIYNEFYILFYWNKPFMVIYQNSEAMSSNGEIIDGYTFNLASYYNKLESCSKLQHVCN
jgi:hypothetical protein